MAAKGDFKDLTGARYGLLTVISKAMENTRRGAIRWHCICDCGNFHVVESGNLKTTKSCGCWQTKHPSNFQHGHSANGLRSPEYKAWNGMKSRCYWTKGIDYPNYGGRGIKVCDRWLNSFEDFLADIGPRPSPKHSLDRINVNGDYEKSNCRWATRQEQSINKRAYKAIENYSDEVLIAELWRRTPEYGLEAC